MSNKEETAPFIHPQAIVESKNIGKQTRIWAFTHVLAQAQIGEDCNICDHVFIENDVVVGNRVTVKCGVQLWDSIVIEDDVFIGPNATFTNDPLPRSKAHLESYPKIILKQGSSIGANATVLPGVTIGRNAMIGAGAVVTKSVPANAIVVGNPGRIVGYVDTEAYSSPVTESATSNQEIKVSGVKLLRSSTIKDLRGHLIAREVGKEIPFTPQRHFFVFNVPSKHIRGEHAHKECHQFLVCTSGSVSCVCDDGTNRQEFLLDSPEIGLYLPPMTWGVQYKYSENALLLVLASHHYDPDDYIRDYDTFLKTLFSDS